MLHPNEAKETYGFRDATDKEDALAVGFLNAIQSIQASRALHIIDMLSPFVLAGLVIALAVYSYYNGVQVTAVALPIFLLVYYVPRWRTMHEHQMQSSGIRHDMKLLGSHFLLVNGICLEKDIRRTSSRPIYSMRVRLLNGQELENVLLIREYYDKINEGQKVYVAMADSDKATQYIGLAASLLDPKVEKEKGKARETVKVDNRKMRRLTEEERDLAAEQYLGVHHALVGRQRKNRSFLILIAIVLAIASIPLDNYVLMTVAILFAFSYAFLFITDWMDNRSTLKALHKADGLFCLDATVDGKPVLTDELKRSKTQVVEFVDARGKLVYRSLKVEDLNQLDIGDEVLLIYLDQQRPLVYKKPHMALESK